MAKNIIKARIKQRSDSAANWAAVNPVLFKGELGLVDDDPNLYKVGDGKTAWNDLPLRGFDGTVAQETGDSTTAVMSQAAVTRALEAANEKIENKVSKETGKGLSSNDFTDTEKEKLAALENYDDSEVKEALSTLAKADTELAEAIGKKVDKVDGKQLTTEDFTTALKEKLQGLTNYDDAEVKAAIEKLRGDFDTLVGGDTSAAIKSFNDIVAFLEGIEDSESLDSIIASIEQQIAEKQDAISDLETIRQGAAKGATALQAVPAEYATKTDVADAVADKVDKETGKGLSSNDYTDTEKAKVEDALKRMTPVTYSELVALKNAGQLIAGMRYRITDYVTTTTQENTQSAGHPFDLVVTALDGSTLSEMASAIVHDGDTYFADAGANLSAWQIWYDLDNDKERFAWADEENGKGVIYRMIDEWSNDCPYDFKNIMFIRYELEAPELYVAEGTEDRWIEILSTNVRKALGNGVKSYIWAGTSEDDYYWEEEAGLVISVPTGYNEAFYTFSSNDKEDASLYGGYKCNTMLPSKRLPNNVFFGNSCQSNSFGSDCYSNSLGGGCNFNSFGSDCFSNIFGNNCRSNGFGNGCFSNSFGDGCFSNGFGNGCYFNSFGSSCFSNGFGSDCYSNIFGNNCNSNGFGNGCFSNIFGNNCNSNGFGNGCYSNGFGNSCQSNSFGGNCYFNSFQNTGGELVDYAQNNSFGNGCSSVILQNDASASSSANIQNYRIANGMEGTIEVTRRLAYETTIAKNSNGEIVQFNIADLV